MQGNESLSKVEAFNFLFGFVSLCYENESKRDVCLTGQDKLDP